MRTPLVTYRLQFHSKFTFKDAEKILGYLTELGISDIYASPIFKARQNSTHGYDVVDPTQINPQLGGKQGFEHIMAKIKGHHLGWIQDIVPNHMAFSSDNLWLMDILEKGPLSRFYHFFDINWNHPYDHLKGKVLAPFLGDIYGTCLDKNEVKLNFDEGGFNILFYDWKFPLRIESYLRVLSDNLWDLEQKINRDDPQYIQFLELIGSLKSFFDISPPEDRYDQIALIKAKLWQIYSSHPVIKEYLDSVVRSFNGIPGDPQSLDRLDMLLSHQNFKLSYWKVGNEELNYRRFFTINALVSVKMENKKVFETTHELILQLIKSGDINGVRIDHIDGLYNPLEYLNLLRQKHQDLYIVVEKILDLHEKLPSSMPVQGTTGYDFMNAVNGIFIDSRNEKFIDRIYSSFTGLHTSYRDLVSEKKKDFMGKYMAGDIDNLALLLKQILNHNRYGKDMTMYALRRSIVEIMAQFPVYRAYTCEQAMEKEDKIYIKEAIALAKNNDSGLTHELEFIENILLPRPNTPEEEKKEYFHFAKRFQQFSAALMAKGAEDTTFYVYNRFISLNEVGSDPSIFGMSIERFHEFMADRQKSWPYTLNSTSTHDTKRGEDVRARLNVISQIPQEWGKHVHRWNKINKKKKKRVLDLKVRAPDRNTEYFIYQTLVGTFPINGKCDPVFIGRIKEYLIKALREAKVYTTWVKPHQDYEEACLLFLEALLDQSEKNEFLESFIPFQNKVSLAGVFNSLSQVLIKITAPGVPDFYQGTELWDFTLVDPDNRRPVDYHYRTSLLERIKDKQKESIQEFLNNKESGGIKLYLIYKSLQVRRNYQDVFLKGEYIPLNVKGTFEHNVLAYARKFNNTWIIVVIGRFLNIEIQHNSWQDTSIILPSGAPCRWQNVLAQSSLKVSQEIPVTDVLTPFPLALLISSSD